MFSQSRPKYKVCLFSILSNAHIVDIEYPQGICLPIFVAEDFSGLFWNAIMILQKPLFLHTFS